MNDNALILWALGGLGLLFIYSAYKGQSPQSILLQSINMKKVTP